MPMKKKEMLTMDEAAPDSALTGRWLRRPVFPAVPTDEVRWERVMRLKAAIEAGKYSVSSAALADRLMEDMLAAGRRGSPERDL